MISTIRQFLGRLIGRELVAKSYHDRLMATLLSCNEQLLAENARLRIQRGQSCERYETLVAECTRHRHATWEITHK